MRKKSLFGGMLCIVLVFGLLIAGCDMGNGDDGGGGPPPPPIEISTLSELNAIGASAASMSKNYKLTANIMGPVTASIGNVSGTMVPFSGDFDGNGYTVTLGITTGVYNGEYDITFIGLFAALEGSVHDLEITGTINITGVSGGVFAGGVAGVAFPGTAISNVASSVSVTAGGSGEVNAGGIVGVSQGAVSHAYATGAVSATTSGTDPDHVNAGGIVGTATGAVSNVYATGAISATSTANNNEVYAGGIAGTATASGAVSYAYATGAITATGATGGGTNQNGNPFTVGAGGIAGAATGTTVRYTVALNSSVTAIGTSYNRCSFRITSTSGGEVTGGPNYGSTGLTPSVSGSGTSHTGDPGATEQGGVDVTVATGTPYTAPDQTWWTDMGFLGANWTTVWEWDGATTGLPKLR